MPINIEKKSEQILINVTPTMYKLLAKIAEIEARPVGYVARELMTRGTDMYIEDGKLREVDSKDAAIAAVREGIRRAIPADIADDESKIAAYIGSPAAERREAQRMIDEAQLKTTGIPLAKTGSAITAAKINTKTNRRTG